MDLVIQAPHIPAPGETVLGAQDLARFPGGKGANQAYAAARLGAVVHMVGRVGGDDLADPVIASLDGVGVDTRHVRRDPDAGTGVGLIVVDAEGQNAIVVASAANARVTVGDVADAETILAACDVLLLQLEIPMTATLAAAGAARRHGVRVILNPAPARTLPAELLEAVDVLVPNETEAAMLTGLPVADDEQVEAAATALLATGIDTVIVTRGDRGCTVASAGHTAHHPTFPVDPVDTTAAGDAFVGGLAAALAAGVNIEAAIRQANAAGALACTRLGAQVSLPHRAAVDRLLTSA